MEYQSWDKRWTIEKQIENNGNNRKNRQIWNFYDFCQKTLLNYVLGPNFEVIDQWSMESAADKLLIVDLRIWGRVCKMNKTFDEEM